MNLAPSDRCTLIKGILESDCNYLNKLLQRKAMLRLEMLALEGSICRKTAEIESMNIQLNMVNYDYL